MPDAAPLPLADPRPPRKLYRSSDGRWLGGVARGLAGHLGLPVIWVRLAFVGLNMADGLGALLYAAFWFFVPLGVGGVEDRLPPSLADTETSSDGRRRRVARKLDRGQILALLLMVVVSLTFVGSVKLGNGTKAYLIPTVLVAAGVALVWRQADNARRARWVEVGRRRRTLTLLRA
ncbi:MAG: PspC domain-containing protein, partial [Streptomyces sp.]|nr:PspC domain-containing protein [Streptomyces sp.]